MCLPVISSFDWQVIELYGHVYAVGIETQRYCVFWVYSKAGKFHHKADILRVEIIFIVFVFCIKIDKCSQFKPCLLLHLQNIVLIASWKGGYFSTVGCTSWQHSVEHDLNPDERQLLLWALCSFCIIFFNMRISKCQANSEISGRREKAVYADRYTYTLLQCAIIWEWAVINTQFISVLGSRAVV